MKELVYSSAPSATPSPPFLTFPTTIDTIVAFIYIYSTSSMQMFVERNDGLVIISERAWPV